MRRYRSTLNRIDAWRAEQARRAEAENLEQLAESTREWLVQYLRARRDGTPLPVLKRAADCGSCDAALGARDRLRTKLAETGQRLRHYLELKEHYGIR